jgi:single-stranded DNA-binding protein
MSDVNICIYTGRMAGPAEVKTYKGGRYCTFSVAVSESWKDAKNPKADKNGYVSHTNWIRCKAWTDWVCDKLSDDKMKGAKVSIVGSTKITKDDKGKDWHEVTVKEVSIIQYASRVNLASVPPDVGYEYDTSEPEWPKREREDDDIPF